MIYRELKEFAIWFNQDFDLLHKDTESGVEAYLGSISNSRRNNLGKEITEFLKEHPGKDHKGLKNAWLRLGAQWWSQNELPTIFKDLAA